MDKTFDNLFNQFFGGKGNKKKSGDKSTDFNKANDDDVKNMIDMISNMEEVTGSYIAGQIDDELGEPNKVEYYEKDGIYFEKKTWKVSGGEMIKIIVSDEPFNKNVEENKESRLTLQEQLEDAVKNEDYETAAKLRDLIKKEEKKQKKIQKDLLL